MTLLFSVHLQLAHLRRQFTSQYRHTGRHSAWAAVAFRITRGIPPAPLKHGPRMACPTRPWTTVLLGQAFARCGAA